MRIIEIRNGAEYRMDEQLKNWLISIIFIVFQIEKIVVFNFSCFKILDIC